MIDPKKIEQLIHQAQDSLLKNIRNLSDNIEKKFRQVLMNQFNKMDLISREEFNKQINILLDIRKKIEQLELRLKTLENVSKNDIDNKNLK